MTQRAGLECKGRVSVVFCDEKPQCIAVGLDEQQQLGVVRLIRVVRVVRVI